jgi:hypothetical protein
MNQFAAAGFACAAALALWKGTKERLWPTLFGMFVIVVTVKYAGKAYDADDDLYGWLIAMTGFVIFTAGAYGLKRYDKRVATLDPSHILAPKPPAPLVPEIEEPEFELETTTPYDYDDSGWERWTVLPNQKQLIRNRCGGGPTVHEEIYEYAVRHTSVFVRLIEKSNEAFDEYEYEVFAGSINTARLEEDYAKKIKKYENDANKDLFLGDTPTIISAELQKEIVWHEIYGAIRYFILNKDVPVVYEANFFRNELERFTNAFAAIEKQAEELGAVLDGSTGCYSAPKDATSEVKENVRQKLSVFNFGFRNRREFLQKDIILGVLNDALGLKPNTTAAAAREK